MLRGKILIYYDINGINSHHIDRTTNENQKVILKPSFFAQIHDIFWKLENSVTEGFHNLAEINRILYNRIDNWCGFDMCLTFEAMLSFMLRNIAPINN